MSGVAGRGDRKADQRSAICLTVTPTNHYANSRMIQQTCRNALCVSAPQNTIALGAAAKPTGFFAAAPSAANCDLNRVVRPDA